MRAVPSSVFSHIGLGHLLAYIVLALSVTGLLNVWIFSTGASEWSQSLINPSWAPPGRVIGLVWMVQFSLMAVAFWLVQKSPDHPLHTPALIMIFIQYAVNVSWVFFYFGLQNIANGFYVTVVAFVINLPTLWLTFKVSRKAALALIPLTAWLIFALILSFTTWQMNIAQVS